MKIKSYELQLIDNDYVIDIYPKINNKKMVNFAKKIDNEEYDSGCWVISRVLNDNLKINGICLYYIGKDDWHVCPYKLNIIQKVCVLIFINKIIKKRIGVGL